MMWVVALAVASVVALDAGWRYIKNRKYHASHPLPPGPRGVPFIGNVIGINPDGPWLTYTEWAKTYGDLIYTQLFGKDVIVINSLKIAKDLLENRSSNYADRPVVTTGEVCGISFSSGLLHYGDQWRLHRRFFHQTFQSEAANRFLPLQHRKACQILRRLLESPDKLSDHVFEYTSSLILNSVYDYDPKSPHDELVDMAARALEGTVLAARADIAVILEAFPMILKLPSWLPGMSFKRELKTARDLAKIYVERPFQHSLEHLPKSGSCAAPSMVYDALLKVEEKGVSANEVWMSTLKDASATGFIAASETSNSMLMTFYLMMTLHPDAQKKAQTQIDAVVGRDRLPSFKDRPSLPYIDAIIRETLRYHPVAPLALPHATVYDDIYNGFYIPKGAVILTNLWAIGHDEFKYPNSNQFIPERFLNDDSSLNDDNVENIAYGFGRRICVGRHFADRSVWSIISKFLATFTISKSKDANGDEIPVELRFSTGLTTSPLPFKFSITPRKPDMDKEMLEQLIQASDV